VRSPGDTSIQRRFRRVFFQQQIIMTTESVCSVAPAAGSSGKVAIVGSGTIGRSWAICFARGGYQVALYDRSRAESEQAVLAIERSLLELQSAGAPLNATTIMRSIGVASTLAEALTGASYAQESVTENQAVKAALFREMDQLAPAQAILASSSSAIMPSLFLGELAGRHRCLVIHPFNPPHLIPLVEIVPSQWTTTTTVAKCSELMTAIGQSPIVLSREVEGFVGNRLQAAVVNEAMNLVHLGVIDPKGLDLCMTHGLARRWAFIGPFATMDLNAPLGFADYARKFRASYQQLGRTLGVGEPWHDEAAERVAEWRRCELPVEAIADAQARRDLQLLHLAGWLQAQTDAI
jgi:3-hydroxyacyl-CoA dehydrogenase